jgi:hypothetical protein
MTSREAPAWFVARLRQYPDFLGVRFNEELARWEFLFKSVAGLETSQFYGWDRNPLTGAVIEPDEFGLLPFRDLDDTACHEILRSCDTTYLGNREDGVRDWKEKSEMARRYNAALRRKSAHQRGQDFAYLIQQMDIRRPGWKKDHPHRPNRIIVA